MSKRHDLRKPSEQATETELRRLGVPDVRDYGQELWPEQVRELLQEIWPPDPKRWLADFIVRLPDDTKVLADAKFALKNTGNHTIEMRALLTARREVVPVWYVCSVYEERDRDQRPLVERFHSFKAIRSDQVPTHVALDACCESCREIYLSSADEMAVNRALPRHCPVYVDKYGPPGIASGSGTPWFLIRGHDFPPENPLGLPHLPCTCQGCLDEDAWLALGVEPRRFRRTG